MASGKFSTPRGSNREEWEIEAAFRQAVGETLPEDTDLVLTDPMLDEPLPEDDALFAPMLSLMINLSRILAEEGRS